MLDLKLLTRRSDRAARGSGTPLHLDPLDNTACHLRVPPRRDRCFAYVCQRCAGRALSEGHALAASKYGLPLAR